LENKAINEHKENLKSKKEDNNKKKNNKRNRTDLIFFAIIAGLGFSVIENLFYLIVHYFKGDGALALSV
jgi:RsiW-degrading membrane proteinase PrsW (M82 family)